MTGSNSSHCLHSRPRCPRRLPAALEAFPSWEAAEEGRWQCASCDYHECPGLQPLERCRQGGFRLAGVNATDRGTIFKVGWTATTAGATTCFPLDGGHAGAQVLVAMLCSYENVGAAAVRLTGPGTVDSTWQPLELRWNAPGLSAVRYEPWAHRPWARGVAAAPHEIVPGRCVSWTEPTQGVWRVHLEVRAPPFQRKYREQEWHARAITRAVPGAAPFIRAVPGAASLVTSCSC